MSNPPLFSLAHDEVCHAVPVAGYAVGSYPAFSPLPSLAVCFLWHYLYAQGIDPLNEVLPSLTLSLPGAPRTLSGIALA